MATLFSKIHFNGLELKNRIVVSPMCQYSSTNGFANDWHLAHYGAFAKGGAGLIVFEATAVSPEGRISPADLGIWEDEHIASLQRVVSFIEKQGSVAGIQLAHAGRKASHGPAWTGGKVVDKANGGWDTVAPSAIAFTAEEPVPAALTLDGIQGIKQAFVSAGKRALQAGFKVIELHAAHGYLLHEFLSPLSNKRADAYGGSFDNRIRLLVEIAENLVKVMETGTALFVRISATDWVEGGWSVEDSIALAKVLKQVGVSLVDCRSGGNVAHVKIPVGPLYQLPFATQIKSGAQVPTGAVGLITTAAEAEDIVNTGKADLVFLGREMLRNPNFALHAAKALQVDLPWPLQYERAKK